MIVHNEVSSPGVLQAHLRFVMCRSQVSCMSKISVSVLNYTRTIGGYFTSLVCSPGLEDCAECAPQ
jgi:hypothetical protein